MYPHPIRLRDPWERSSEDGERTVYRRYFHAPTISPGERVFVVVEGLRAAATVTLNGMPLGEWIESDGPQEFEISSLVVPRNELTLSIPTASAAAPTGPWTEVRLEIRWP